MVTSLKICSIGHRYIVVTNLMIKFLTDFFENCILNENVSSFIFGSKSQFNDLCYDIVSNLEKKYPHIKRIYYMSYDFELEERFKDMYLEHYEDVLVPQKVFKSGKLAYVKRNEAMIDDSDICLFYYNENSNNLKSGTKIAFEYAKKKKKKIVNIFDKI